MCIRDSAQATRERNTRQETTGRADLLAPIAPVPREIIVPVEPARREELEGWLTNLRGGAVTIRVASRGDKKQLMDRANENASQALHRSKMSRISDMGARTQAMNDVAKALGLAEAPLRIECYDISNTVGGAFPVSYTHLKYAVIVENKDTYQTMPPIAQGICLWGYQLSK